MTAISLALLAASLGADPVPGDKATIDSLRYSFGGGGLLGRGSLTIGADGKVKYFYSFDSHTDTGSAGRVVQKEWELTKEERTELFAKLVADGLLGADTEPNRGALFDGISVTSGRWRTSIDPKKVPDKAMKRLRELMAKADPKMWGPEPAPAPREVRLHKGLRQFNYWFAPKAEGDNALLYLGRDGDVSYKRYSQKGQSTTTHVQTAWKIPAADAATILDALAAGGVLELENVGAGKFPTHRVEALVGRWYTLFYVKEFPERDRKLLLPLLQKADPEFWK